MRAAWYDRQGPARGDLRYPIAARLPLAEIAHAHELAEHSSASGRVVLDI
ncbi:hypothetical protein AB0K35_12295 [Micromonospora sp. NPDC053740]|nr:hypothetical protein [Micromonospora alfalfae]MCG5462713.1 hypothetical protein [Micromonospora alfalfae]